MKQASDPGKQASPARVPHHSPLGVQVKSLLGCLLSHPVLPQPPPGCMNCHHSPELPSQGLITALQMPALCLPCCVAHGGRGPSLFCSFSSPQSSGWHRGNAQEICSIKKIFEFLFSNPGAILAIGSSEGESS